MKAGLGGLKKSFTKKDFYMKATKLFDEQYMLSEHYRATAIQLFNGDRKCGCEQCSQVVDHLLVRPKETTSTIPDSKIEEMSRKTILHVEDYVSKIPNIRKERKGKGEKRAKK